MSGCHRPDDWPTPRRHMRQVPPAPVEDFFTVEHPKAARIALTALGIFGLVLFGGVYLLLTIGTLVDHSTAADWAYYAFFSVVSFGFFTLYAAMLGMARSRIVVEGTVLSAVPIFGRVRVFSVADVAALRVTVNGRRLVDQSGKTLARFQPSQKNSQKLLQYLRNNGVGPMG